MDDQIVEYMGYVWTVHADWDRVNYRELTGLMSTRFSVAAYRADRLRYVVQTVAGWYEVPMYAIPDRDLWVGPFATWQEAATVLIAKEALS